MKKSQSYLPRNLRIMLAVVLSTVGVLTTQYVAAASWSAAKVLSNYSLFALPTNTASIAVDGSGNAIAVWVNESNYVVQVASRKLGVWGAAQVLYRPSSLNGETTSDAKVVFGSDGSATAIFASTIPGKIQYCVVGGRVVRCLGPSTSYAKVARLAAGSLTWSKPVNVSAKGIAVANTQLGVDANGNAIAAWTYVESANAVTQLQTAKATANGAWSAPAMRYSGSTLVRPLLAVNENGDAAIAWQERTAGASTYTIRMLASSVSGTDTFLDVATLAAQAWNLRIGIAANNDISVAWDDGYAVRRTQCIASTGCAVAEPVESAPGLVYGTDVYAYAPDMAVNANGDMLVSWVEMNARTGEWKVIAQMRHGADVYYSAEWPVDGQSSVPMADVAISRDAAAGFVGWIDYGSGMVTVAQVDAAQGWLPLARIGSGAWGSQVEMGSGANAQGSAVWVATTATEFKYRVMASSLVF